MMSARQRQESASHRLVLLTAPALADLLRRLSNNVQNSSKSSCPSQLRSPLRHSPPTKSFFNPGSNSARNFVNATGDKVATAEPAFVSNISRAPPRNIPDKRTKTVSSCRSISSGVGGGRRTSGGLSCGKEPGASSEVLGVTKDFALPMDLTRFPIIRLQAVTALVAPPACGAPSATSGASLYFSMKLCEACPALRWAWA
mmetsp:Transcript_96588/g.278822  ORF Transcript_96588/g.278822 Transcript_96588/m.278822 type:complete len:200 (-) Transcript_96588:1254-1853(-)